METTNRGGSRWITAALAGALGFALGTGLSSDGRMRAPALHEGDRGRVTGIGGVFFESADPVAPGRWYRRHLGIVPGEWGGAAFPWREHDRPDVVGYTVWGPFSEGSVYFEPSERPFMVNFRVADLRGLELRAEGVQGAGEIEEHPNDLFAWILDPDGTKIELWQPTRSAEDPYLRGLGSAIRLHLGVLPRWSTE